MESQSFFVSYIATSPSEDSNDDVLRQIDLCDEVSKRIGGSSCLSFIDRGAVGEFSTNGRPGLSEAIREIEKHQGNAYFIVVGLERLSSNPGEVARAVLRLVAAKCKGLYSKDGPIDWLRKVESTMKEMEEQIDLGNSLETRVKELQNQLELINKVRMRDFSCQDLVDFRAAIQVAIERSDRTVNSIARAASVPQPVLFRFLRGERGINVKSLEKLCLALGITIALPPWDQ